eukprot:TRINITY_DN16570_c0_g1_i1.p1 TRINITY_DN16570_c0_g1~~TRINITY_DN16570_c0_g1_i1.p1  ORF type:complete len:114 (-),score=29.52 TRINITY_DN16570_c0_g1_i1:84-425(-)
MAGARTTNAALQAKLDQWASLCQQGMKREFIEDFCAPDIGVEDKQGFLDQLEADPAHWESFSQEIIQLSTGPISCIRGDQKTQAIFVFSRPELENIDREVVFQVFDGDWKSNG